ncbi:hypothetical protein [Parafrankia sp. FMc2]|uniref:hypothetical protein n=1 Tax=Parafrankia sp. FMc2 TaxID=3233196 RepID=UPI0034D4064E
MGPGDEPIYTGPVTAGAPDQPVGARCEPAAITVGAGLPLWAATRCGRAVRGAVLALLTVALAAAAHGRSGPAAPDSWVTVVGFLLTWRVGWGLAARQISRRRLIGLVVAAQGCLHLAFAMASPPGRHSGAGAGHLHSEAVAGSGGVDLLHGGPTVLGLHLLAAVCLAWWLAAGERLLWRVGRRTATATRRIVRRVRGRLAAPPRPVLGPRLTFSSSVPAAAARLALLRYAVARRGPPAATAR